MEFKKAFRFNETRNENETYHHGVDIGIGIMKKKTVIMHTKEGKEMDIRETERVDLYVI